MVRTDVAQVKLIVVDERRIGLATDGFPKSGMVITSEAEDLGHGSANGHAEFTRELGGSGIRRGA